jgi:hypothetical protein
MSVAFAVRFEQSIVGKDPSIEVGTQTMTEIRTEATDSDALGQHLLAVPRSPLLGTETMTRVRGEGSDQDPARASLRAVPGAMR